MTKCPVCGKRTKSKDNFTDCKACGNISFKKPDGTAYVLVNTNYLTKDLVK